MLHLHPVRSFHEKEELLRSFDPERQTWVVSDLRSKLDIQKRLLEHRPLLEEEAILRASELWRKAAVRALPEFQIVTKDLVQIVCQKKLARSAHEWARRPGVPKLVFQYITQLMPMLSHPQGPEILNSWFEENPQSHRRWGHWAEVAAELWRAFLDEKILSPQWISGALYNLNQPEKLWPRDLVIDLGAELSAVEAELLKSMAKEREVRVVVPAPAWHEEYYSALAPYRLFDGKKEKPVQPPAAAVKTGVAYARFTTMTAEVKNAVAQARAWLEAGVPAPEIAIAAPDIEVYWPSLQMHLAFEGIPVAKKVVTRLQSLPLIARWLSELRLQAGQVSKEDLELRFYSGDGEGPLPFAEFERLFTAVYGREDLDRVEEVRRFYEKKTDLQAPVGLREFILWSLKYWPKPQDSEVLESVVRGLHQEVPAPMHFTIAEWISLLQGFTVRSEREVRTDDPAGISCLNLFSAEYLPCSHLILLGISESGLADGQRSQISLADTLSIAQQTGFSLASADSRKGVFECQWLLEREFEKVLVCFSETDFSGTPLAPSILWLRGRLAAGENLEQRTQAMASRWDRWLQTDFSALTETLWLAGAEGIRSELFDGREGTFGADRVRSVSATSLERYLECPFRFASEKIFRLSDLPSLDLDVDRQTRGTLMHKILEKLIPGDRAKDENWNFSDEDLRRLVEDSYRESDVKIMDERLWPPLRDRYVAMAARVLQFERQWQERFPRTRTVGKEVQLRGAIDIESGGLVKNREGKTVAVNGRIDRVDSDGNGNYVLIDYKSSKGSLRQFGSWMKNDQLQMALYAAAFEAGLTDVQDGRVVGAVYYLPKDLNREVGFKLEAGGEELFAFESRAQNKIDERSKQELFSELQEKIKTGVQAIVEGKFPARPSDERLCSACKWKELCRAPHLT